MPDREDLLKETVFPSEERTILPLNRNDGFGGAYTYLLRKFIGFEHGQTIYSNFDKPSDNILLPFPRKFEDGTIQDGVQNEQLIIVLKDRIKKLDAKFPHPENQNMLKALDDFLEASKRRVEERMDRGVMGELKK